MSSTLLTALDRLLEANARLRKRRALSRLERRLTRAMQRAFRAQGRAFVRRLGALRDRFPRETQREAALREAIEEFEWGPLFDDAVLATLRLFQEPLDEVARQALVAGALSAIAELQLDVSFSLEHPRAVQYIASVGAERVTRITDTTRDELRTILTQATSEGWSYDRTARAITAKYADFAGPPLRGRPQHIASRAHLIAITETGDAYEAGNRAVADDLASAGLEMEKSWLIVGDERTCPICNGNAQAGWIPLERAFPSGHQQPTGHPGCRCTARWRRKGAGE